MPDEGRAALEPRSLTFRAGPVLKPKESPALARHRRQRFFMSPKEEADFVTLLNGGDCLAALLPDDDADDDDAPSVAASINGAPARRAKRKPTGPPRRNLMTYFAGVHSAPARGRIHASCWAPWVSRALGGSRLGL